MHISPGGHGGIIHGSVDTLLLLVSKPNFGRSVVLDRVVVDVLVLLSYFIPGICCRCASVCCVRDKKNREAATIIRADNNTKK